MTEEERLEEEKSEMMQSSSRYVRRERGERNRGGTSRGECYTCGEEGHFSRDCPQKPKTQNKKECYTCGSDQHLARDCPEKQQSRRPPQGACYTCGQEGHFARDCPNQQEGGGKNFRMGRGGGPYYDWDQGNKASEFDHGLWDEGKKKKYEEEKKKVTKKEKLELDKRKEMLEQQKDEVAEQGKTTLLDYQKSKKKVVLKQGQKRVVEGEEFENMQIGNRQQVETYQPAESSTNIEYVYRPETQLQKAQMMNFQVNKPMEEIPYRGRGRGGGGGRRSEHRGGRRGQRGGGRGQRGGHNEEFDLNDQEFPTLAQ